MSKEAFKTVPVRTEKRICEVAWFDDLCGGDTAFLGNVDPQRRSNYAHCANIMKTADRMGFKNILLPPSYITGQEVIPFAAAMAPQVKNINIDRKSTRLNSSH